MTTTTNFRRTSAALFLKSFELSLIPNQASLPYDLTIITRMNRGLRPNTPDRQLMFKEQNVYFHVHLSCLKMKQPYFNPAYVTVPNWLPHYLTPEHVRFLRSIAHITP